MQIQQTNRGAKKIVSNNERITGRKKIKLIYVVGEARSGSTILGLILGNHEKVQNVGELWTFLEKETALKTRRTRTCSCRMSIDECHFWVGVKRRFLDYTGEETLNRSAYIQRKNERYGEIWKEPLGLNSSELRERYYRRACFLFRAIEDISRKEWILDTSKGIKRAFLMNSCPDVDAHYIHLIKDPRGILYSAQKSYSKHLRRLRERGVPLHKRILTYFNPRAKVLSPPLFLIRWIIKNLITGRLKYGTRNYCKINYEDLVSNPDAVLGKLERFLDLDLKDIAENLKQGKVFNSGHMISGNHRVYLDRPIKLFPDFKWKRELNKGYLLFYYLLYPLCRLAR
jgi:hypothetical protein